MLPKFAAPLSALFATPLSALPRGEVSRPVLHASRLSPMVLAGVVLAHAGVVAALASLRGVTAPVPTHAVMVEVITAAADAPKTLHKTPDKTLPLQPKPKPVAQTALVQPIVKAPLLATPSAAPSAVAQAAETTQSVAQPAAQTPVQAAHGVQGVQGTTPAPASQTAPRFDADYLDNPAPVYPPLSRRVGEEGKVLLRVYVEPSGVPSRVEVRTSSGYERLDQSAATAVGRWKFLPARLGAEVVGAWVLVPIVFNLKG